MSIATQYARLCNEKGSYMSMNQCVAFLLAPKTLTEELSRPTPSIQSNMAIHATQRHIMPHSSQCSVNRVPFPRIRRAGALLSLI